MLGRFIDKSKIVFGPPHTFGWVRRPEMDTNGLEGWERPDGTPARLPRGAQLGRIRGALGHPMFLRRATWAE